MCNLSSIQILRDAIIKIGYNKFEQVIVVSEQPTVNLFISGRRTKLIGDLILNFSRHSIVRLARVDRGK